MELFDFVIKFILVILCTFSISSMLLYSPGPSGFRNWWIGFFNKFENKLMKKPMFLMICQLCISFWIAIVCNILIIGYSNLVTLLVVAFSSAGVSWLLGAFTLMCLHIKDYSEVCANSLREKYDKK